jgi:cellobiose phosphorylase
MKKYFTFNDQQRSINIHRHDTPQPWINYLSNGNFHAFVSQAGGGFAWWKTPVFMRLTRYRQYNLPIDSPGFYIYIKHNDGTVWSPTFRPCETMLDSWHACHQPGKSTFIAEKNGIKAKLTLFVPPDYDVLLWDLELINNNDNNHDLDIFAYVEHSQLNWQNEGSWGYYTKLQLKTWFDEQAQCVNYLCHADNPRQNDVPLVYLACNQKVHSYSGSRDHFIGDYRTEHNPIAVEHGHCGNNVIQCGEPASSLQSKLSLAPSDPCRVTYILGIAPAALIDLKQAEIQRDRILTELQQSKNIDAQEIKLDGWWEEHFNAYQCEIPDASAKRQINTWNVINSVNTARYSRSLNTVAPGIRGVGFRDSCQDMLAIAYRRPDWATKMFKFLLSQQFRDGHTVHYAYPEEHQPPTLSVHSDNHLWLPLLANAILSETGNFSLLNEKISYLSDDAKQTAGEGNIWKHLLAAIHFTENNLGKHKIPLTFHSDWNDIIGRFNRHGKGETAFAAMQYVLCLRYMIEIAKIDNRPELGWLQQCLANQITALNNCAWDGKWWRRGFDDNGTPVGSNATECGKIFLNPQSWAVISQIGEREQQQSGMNAANRMLNTPLGLKILSPSFASWNDAGEAQVGYGPGCGENGAIFCHANTWAIIAETMLGNADRAWQYFTQLIPTNAMKTAGIEHYRAEPYAWVSNIVGAENSRSGWANVEQITGTAPWMDIVSTQYLLGIRPTLNGLLIDPCIPADWNGFTVQRRYRGAILQFSIQNQSFSNKGIKQITLDGRAIAGNLIKPEQIAKKGIIKVTVTM